MPLQNIWHFLAISSRIKHLEEKEPFLRNQSFSLISFMMTVDAKTNLPLFYCRGFVRVPMTCIA